MGFFTDESKDAVRKYEKAQDELENYRDGDGSANDKKFLKLNDAVHEAGENVSWLRKHQWL